MMFQKFEEQFRVDASIVFSSFLALNQYCETCKNIEGTFEQFANECS